MKTAIIKTDFWKEEKIFDLLPDARYFYICILTNPERNTTPAFKCNNRMMEAYTGYDTNTIKNCQEELKKRGLIKIVDGYYIINEQDYVQPTKGRLSDQLYEKDYESLPLKIQKLFRNPFRYGSGTVPEYNNKDNNNDKDNNNLKDTSNISSTNKKEDNRSRKDTEIDNYIQTCHESLRQTLTDFVEARKNIKKPFTLRAVQLVLSKVESMYPNDYKKQIECINQSIMNGWQSVWPLQQPKGNNQPERKFM